MRYSVLGVIEKSGKAVWAHPVRSGNQYASSRPVVMTSAEPHATQVPHNGLPTPWPGPSVNGCKLTSRKETGVEPDRRNDRMLREICR